MTDLETTGTATVLKFPTATMCWRCSNYFGVQVPTCPKCNATNGNVDFGKAMLEAQEYIGAAIEHYRTKPTNNDGGIPPWIIG